MGTFGWHAGAKQGRCWGVVRCSDRAGDAWIMAERAVCGICGRVRIACAAGGRDDARGNGARAVCCGLIGFRGLLWATLLRGGFC